MKFPRRIRIEKCGIPCSDATLRRGAIEMDNGDVVGSPVVDAITLAVVRGEGGGWIDADVIACDPATGESSLEGPATWYVID